MIVNKPLYMFITATLLIEKEALALVFSDKFCKIPQNTFLKEQLRVTGSNIACLTRFYYLKLFNFSWRSIKFFRNVCFQLHVLHVSFLYSKKLFNVKQNSFFNSNIRGYEVTFCSDFFVPLNIFSPPRKVGITFHLVAHPIKALFGQHTLSWYFFITTIYQKIFLNIIPCFEIFFWNTSIHDFFSR